MAKIHCSKCGEALPELKDYASPAMQWVLGLFIAAGSGAVGFMVAILLALAD